MSAEVTLAEIEDCVRRLSETVTPEDIRFSRQLRKRVIEQPHNLYVLISFLEEGVNDRVAMLILQYIEGMINIYQTNFPLMEILNRLMCVSVSDSVSAKLGLCIREIANIMYRTLPADEKQFVLSVPEDTSISVLTDHVFTLFFESFDELVEEIGDSPKKRAAIFEEFRVKYAREIIEWAVRCAQNTPFRALHLIQGCLVLGQDEESSASITSPGFLNLLEFVSSEGFFQWLFEIALGDKWPESDQAWRVATIIARGINVWKPETQVLVPLVQGFVVKAVENRDILIADVDNKCVRFHNLLLAIQPISPTHPYHEMIDVLFDFMLFLLNRCDKSMVVILPGLLNIMISHMMYYSRDKSSELGVVLQGRMKGVMKLFIENAVRICGVDCRVIQEVLENIDGAYESLKRMWTLCNLTIEEVSSVAELVLAVIDKAMTAPFGEANCCALGVVELVMNIAIERRQNCMDQSIINAFIDAMFRTIQGTEEAIKQVQSKEFAETLELVQLELLHTFVDQFFNDIQHDHDFRNRKQNLTVVSEEKDITTFLIRHLFQNLSHELQVERTSEHLIRFLDRKRLMSFVSETELPMQLLQSWMNMKPCPALYAMIVNLLLPDSGSIDKGHVRHQFFESFVATFQVPLRPEVAEGCFSFMANLFAMSMDHHAWRNLARLLLDVYSDAAIQVSQSEHWQVILRFLEVLTSHNIFENYREKEPGPILPLKTMRKNPQGIFRLIVMLAKNCVERLLEKLKPMTVDESVFTCALLVSETELQGTNVRDEESDAAWEDLTSVFVIAHLIFKSPLCNFGMLEMFNDKCADELTDVLIEASSRTSHKSWLCVNGMCHGMLKFIRSLTNTARPDFFLADERRRNFVYSVTRVAFLSNSYDARAEACLVLRDVLLYSRFPECIGLFEPHFVLALNISLRNDMEEADMFLYRYLCKCDSRRLMSCVIEPIKRELTLPEARDVFSRGWDELFVDHVIPAEMRAVIENDQPVMVTVREEQRFPVFCNCKQGESIFVERMKNFKLQLSPFSIELDYLPSLEMFFDFGDK